MIAHTYSRQQFKNIAMAKRFAENLIITVSVDYYFRYPQAIQRWINFPRKGIFTIIASRGHNS